MIVLARFVVRCACSSLVALAAASAFAACSGGGSATPVAAGPTPMPAVSPTLAASATPMASSTPNANASPPRGPATPTPTPTAVPTSAATPAGNVLVVGPGRPYATLGAAVAAAHDGDTIDVVHGTYTNDFAGYVNAANLTIQGVGGMVTETYTQSPPNFKAPLTVENGLTLKNFIISGVAIPSGEGNNGAGIRLEGGNLSVFYCYFHDNQEGILVDAVPGATVTIDHSEFAHNGAGDGYSHNLYINAVASLSFTNDYSHDAIVGHDLKSRALATTIAHSVIADGPSGTASYEIDLPNAGNVSIVDSFIEKGQQAQNPSAVHYGGESLPAPYPVNALTMTGDTLVNAYGPSGVAILNAGSVLGLNVAPSVATGTFWGFASGNAVQGGPTATLSGDTFQPTISGAPAIPTMSPWSGAPVIPIPARPGGRSNAAPYALR